MTAILPEQEQTEIRKTFELFDIDRSGCLSKEELGKVVRSTGCNPTQKELDEMFRSIDRTGYGEIHYEDFLDYYANNFYDPLRDEEQETKEAFRMFDENGDGYIDVQELQYAMTKMGDEALTQEEAQAMIDMADVDQDGRIDYEEFCRMMNTKDA